MNEKLPAAAPKKPLITPEIKGFFSTWFLKQCEMSPETMLRA